MKEEEEEVSEFVSATEQLIFFQGLSAISVFLAYLLSFNVGEFVLAGCHIAVSLLIFGGVWLCKSFLDDVHRKLEVEDLTKYTNNYLVGFCSIGLCTIVLRIGVYFAVTSFWFIFFITLVYITTTSSIYYFFVYPTFGIKCKLIQMDEETSENFTLTTVLSHIALLIVSCVLADEAKMGTIMLYQFGCSFASAITFYEFARVWWVGVQLIDVDEEKNEGIKESKEELEPSRFAIAIGTLYLIFAELKTSNFIFVGCLIAASLLIFGGVWLCKKVLDFVHRCLKVKDLTKYRNDYIIGFGAIGASAIVFRVVVYFVEFDFLYFFFITILYLITTQIIYLFFVLPTFDEDCTWADTDSETDSELSENIYCTSFLSHIALLIVSIRIATEYSDTMTCIIILCQLFCSFAATITIAEFVYLLMVGVELIKDEEEEEEEMVAVVTVPKVVQKNTSKEPEPTVASNVVIAPKPTCNICLIPYTISGVHIPRIIEKCGHTVCEQCIDNLLKPNNGRFLDCPFCQKMTVVNGPAKNLNKNYGMLEMMAELQRYQGPSQMV